MATKLTRSSKANPKKIPKLFFHLRKVSLSSFVEIYLPKSRFIAATGFALR
jgi:hypothetical protein